MNKTTTEKAEYMRKCNVRDYSMTYDNKIKRDFFGNTVILEDNP